MQRRLNGIVLYPIIVVKGDLVLEKINLSDVSKNLDRL